MCQKRKVKKLYLIAYLKNLFFMNVFQQRRKQVQSYLKPNEALVLFAASHKIRNRDVEYKFRQDSDYYYLTGITEPDGILFLKSDYSCHFCLPKDKEKEIWTGIRLGKQVCKEILQVDESFELTDWNTKKEELFTNVFNLYYFFGKDFERDREILEISNTLQKKLRDGKFGPSQISIPEFLHEMRMIKSPEELEILRKAVLATEKAHKKLMQTTKPGMYEFELEAILEGQYRKSGGESGYNPIVASGANATILHYTTNKSQLKEGDLVLVDSGAEIDYYTADVTRVFPVNKNFSTIQKDVYQVVLDAQKKAIQNSKAGNLFWDIHTSTIRLLSEGLKALGIFKESLDEILEKELYKKFYMHKTGHWLGMDVHDVGRYYTHGRSQVLQNGQVMTVEPGLYFDPSDEAIPKEFRGIGIRIEDDVLINGEEPIVLTKNIPKEILEIESLRDI